MKFDKSHFLRKVWSLKSSIQNSKIQRNVKNVQTSWTLKRSKWDNILNVYIFLMLQEKFLTLKLQGNLERNARENKSNNSLKLSIEKVPQKSLKILNWKSSTKKSRKKDKLEKRSSSA